MDRKYDVITLGEILLRLSTPINGRLAQGDTLMKHLGGAELNIASEIGQLGLKTAMISKIPNNLLAAFIKNQMNASRVSENYLISDTADDSRIGVYYYEYGSYPRKPRVVYDRKHSSINNIDIKDVPETMFYNTRLFHTSGITLGLGGNAQKFAIECIRKFKEQGTLISFDVNYRANLWTGEEARACIEQILPYVDIFFCSEDTARLTFGKTGTIEEIQKSFCEEYPISVVASTERTVITPKKHNFTSIIYSAKNDSYYREEPYNNIDVGTGKIVSKQQDENAIWLTVGAAPEILRYIVEKGSVAIDGVSLTIAYADEQVFKVSVIPHTQEETTLVKKEIGDVVNLENDMIVKYVEKLMGQGKPKGGLTLDFLVANGF